MSTKPMPQQARTFKTSQLLLRGFLIFPLLIILLSCATVSPLNSAREKPHLFKDVESVKPVWQTFETESIGYFHGKIAQPKLEFWALKIDLSAPDTQIVVSGGDLIDGQTYSQKVTGFVRENALAAGINAVPFNVSTTKEGVPIKNMGLVISGGETLAPVNPRYDAIVFFTHGKAAIISQSSINSLKNIESAAGGFHHILKNGEPAQRTLDRPARHPRSAAALSASGEQLILLVIDGRRRSSVGGTEMETALLLRALGGTEGLNLDGGGSSALAMRFPDGSVKPVNTPVHNILKGVERAAAGCIGVFVNLSREK